MQTSKERERHLFHLAGLLLFEVEKQGDSFTLTRTADTETPLHQGGLSLEEARGGSQHLEAARSARRMRPQMTKPAPKQK